MEDPAQRPEEAPLLHPAVGGNHAWLQAVPIKWILLGVLSVVVLSAIGLLSDGSLDYHVWIETVVSMDAKQRQSALFSLAGDATTLFLVYAPYMDRRNCGWANTRRQRRINREQLYSIWMWYGLVLPTVNYSVSIVNFIGAMFHLGYLVVFFTCCERRFFFFSLVGIGVVFGMGVAGVDVYLKFAGHELASVVGCSGALTGAAMYLMSTFDNMVVAHRINGNEGKAMLLATFLNATLWTVYARIIKDNLMLFPSSTGVILSVCQVFQRCLYHFYMPAGELQTWIIGIWNAWFRGHGGDLIDPNNNDPAGVE